MNTHYGKSRFIRQKQSTKSSVEDNTPEEEELKKYRELIEKLDGEFKNKTAKVKINSMYSSSINTGGTSNGNDKSSYMRRTISRTKEVVNDRDFLINFMNNDSMPILPKNMHLLSDNDTNQSISDETKYKNLADLMIEDRETVVETHFVRNVDDKMILKLYTALSRKSKDIFMDENHEEQSKNRILFHKLNNIKMPSHEINDPSVNNEPNKDNNLNNSNDSNQDFDNNDIYNNNKNNILIYNENNENDENNNAIKENENDEEKKENEEKNKLEFDENCKYNKKNKENIIKIPTLEKYNPYQDKYHSRRFHKFRPKNLWDPEIDGDFLSYINHNIICIEDIYNKNKDKTLNINNSKREEEINPIEAKEIFYDNTSTNQNKSEYNTQNIDDNENEGGEKNKSIDNSQKKELSNIEEENENENRVKNKFCEFKDRHPNLIEISLPVDYNKQKVNVFHNELKDIFYNRINEVGEFAEEIFPSKGIDLKPSKIYRYALNNERNEEVSTDRITLLSSIKSSEPPTPKTAKSRKTTVDKNNLRRKKTMFDITKAAKTRKLTNDNFIKKKSQDNLNSNLNFNFSNLLKRENERESGNKKTTNKGNENEEIQNNIGNFSLIEKKSQNNNEDSIDKKSLSDNINNIFNFNNENKDNINEENEEKQSNSVNEENEISLKKLDNSNNSINNITNENFKYPSNRENILSFSKNSDN